MTPASTSCAASDPVLSARRPLDVATPYAMVTDPSDAPRPLTDRQRQVLTFVTDEVLRCGVPPTLREIAVYLGVTVNGARDHRDALVRKGALTHDADIARGLRVVTAALPNVEVRDAAGFVVATYRPLPANSRGTDR